MNKFNIQGKITSIRMIEKVGQSGKPYKQCFFKVAFEFEDYKGKKLVSKELFCFASKIEGFREGDTVLVDGQISVKEVGERSFIDLYVMDIHPVKSGVV